jgi:hypothetical protein
METDGDDKTTIRRFKVKTVSWANIEITSPRNGSTHTWNYIKTVPINFTWNWWGSPLISKYTYKVINTKYDVNWDWIIGIWDIQAITNCMAWLDNNPKCDINWDWIIGNWDIQIIHNCMAWIINAIASGSVNKNSDWSYSIPGSPLYLPSGTYRFEVTMLDDANNSIIPTVSHTFNVVIPSRLNITTPPAW